MDRLKPKKSKPQEQPPQAIPSSNAEIQKKEGVITTGEEMKKDEQITMEDFKKQVQSQYSVGARLAAFGALIFSFVSWTALALPFFLTRRQKYGGISSVATPKETIHNAFAMLPIKNGRGRRFIDLGSGTGTFVLEAASRGFRAKGLELNPWLHWLSVYRSYRVDLAELAQFVRNIIHHKLTVVQERKDFWQEDLSEYDVIALFGSPTSMQRAELKFDAELKPNSYVISILNKLPNWVPIAETEDVIIYQKELSKKLKSEKPKQTVEQISEE